MSRDSLVNPVKAAVAEAFAGAGFTKKSDTWYHETPEAVLLGNLQKSQFGEQYYLNLAVWMKAVGEAKWPKEHQAHVRLRVEALVRGFPVDLLDLGKSAGTPEERHGRIKEVLSQEVLPRLLALGTAQGIGDALAKGKLGGAMIHRAVRDFLPAR